MVEDPLGYAVTESTHVVADRTLAEAVADELDRVDPLPAPPCPHEGNVVGLPQLDLAPADWPRLCNDCGQFV